jgi:hypothetical protein
VKRRLAVFALALGAACTEVTTDPNAIVAVRFDGSAYPSIVAGDSLRDSLGALQPLRATGLNYKGDPIEGAGFVFSSPDTVLRVYETGDVFATRRKTDATPARVFATAGKLQTVPDSLFVVQRADSIKALRQVDTLNVATDGGTTGPDSIMFAVFGDTAAGTPKAPVPAWLVSFQLRYHGTTISAEDTSYAFTFETAGSGSNFVRVQRLVDTTNASGAAGRRVFVRTLSQPEDTIVLVATMHQRLANSAPIRDSAFIVIRPKPPTP